MAGGLRSHRAGERTPGSPRYGSHRLRVVRLRPGALQHGLDRDRAADRHRPPQRAELADRDRRNQPSPARDAGPGSAAGRAEGRHRGGHQPRPQRLAGHHHRGRRPDRTRRAGQGGACPWRHARVGDAARPQLAGHGARRHLPDVLDLPRRGSRRGVTGDADPAGGRPRDVPGAGRHDPPQRRGGTGPEACPCARPLQQEPDRARAGRRVGGPGAGAVLFRHERAGRAVRPGTAERAAPRLRRDRRGASGRDRASPRR